MNLLLVEKYIHTISISAFKDLEMGMSGGQYGMSLELSEKDFASFWKERWVLPRVARYPYWNSLDSRTIIQAKLA